MPDLSSVAQDGFRLAERRRMVIPREERGCGSSHFQTGHMWRRKGLPAEMGDLILDLAYVALMCTDVGSRL